MASQEELKREAAAAVLAELKKENLDSLQLGIGTGSTVNLLIALLAEVKHLLRPVAVSSKRSAEQLKRYGIASEDTNMINGIDIYLDGADEIDGSLRMIKGGGGALTGEKILAHQSKQFWCLVDPSKKVDLLGEFPVAVEVVQQARSLVARELVRAGGNPEYRKGFVSDHNNPILDVYGLDLTDPIKMEELINNLPGVVANGIFARNPATRLFCPAA